MGQNNALVVSDPTEAREIQNNHDGDVLVIPVDNYHTEQGHTYSFRVPELPWKTTRTEAPDKQLGKEEK